MSYIPPYEIINGVYHGPDVWEGDLRLKRYKNTLTSLGNLQEVKEGFLDLQGCSLLTSLGQLTKTQDVDMKNCTSLKTLTPLKENYGFLDLEGCSNLETLGSLENLHGWQGWVDLTNCTSIVSLGNLRKITTGKKGGSFGVSISRGLCITSNIKWKHLDDYDKNNPEHKKISEDLDPVPLWEVIEYMQYYEAMPLHKALNALLTLRVQEVPLFRNILTNKLQGVYPHHVQQ
jgi:hypothetical protein